MGNQAMVECCSQHCDPTRSIGRSQCGRSTQSNVGQGTKPRDLRRVHRCHARRGRKSCTTRRVTAVTLDLAGNRLPFDTLPNAQVNPRCAASVDDQFTPNRSAAHVGLNRLLGHNQPKQSKPRNYVIPQVNHRVIPPPRKINHTRRFSEVRDFPQFMRDVIPRTGN